MDITLLENAVEKFNLEQGIIICYHKIIIFYIIKIRNNYLGPISITVIVLLF